jgi:pimeloyl-ACP methyl ester carboxylesterase
MKASGPRWSKVLLGIVMVIAVTITVTVVASTRNTSTLSWHPCHHKFECATLLVPVSYSNNSLGTMHLALIMFPSRSQHPMGDLVTNPGGPGGSGVNFLENNFTVFSKSLRAKFNLVSWDPRGVGASTAVNCGGAKQTLKLALGNGNPDTRAQEKLVQTTTDEFVLLCKKDTPAKWLNNFGTLNTVRDLDRIRAALGGKKLNYIGFSYGTEVGEIYAETFPHHIRAMTLDGVVNPALSIMNIDRSQLLGVQGQLRAFYAWCPTDTQCHSYFAHGVQSALNNLFIQLDAGRNILVRSAPGGAVSLNLALAETSVISSLYSHSSWPYLSYGIHQAQNGNAKLLVELAYDYLAIWPKDRASNETPANFAINCDDTRPHLSIPQIRNFAVQLNRLAPYIGEAAAWGIDACDKWPNSKKLTAQPVYAPMAPPVLLIGSTGDPATPYSEAVAVSHQFTHVVLLTRIGGGHTGYGFSSCIRKWTDRYLETLKLPAVGTSCASH